MARGLPGQTFIILERALIPLAILPRGKKAGARYLRRPGKGQNDQKPSCTSQFASHSIHLSQSGTQNRACLRLHFTDEFRRESLDLGIRQRPVARLQCHREAEGNLARLDPLARVTVEDRDIRNQRTIKPASDQI